MFPTLISIGPLHISSFAALLTLAFIIFSFYVWKSGRDRGINDDKIFDNIVVVAISAFIGSRLMYVLSHSQVFSTNWLRTFLVWRFPGFSFWGALIFGLVAFYYYTKKQKLIRVVMFDCYGQALPVTILFIAIGVFLDGSLLGKETKWFIGVPAVGEMGKRHPLGLYMVGMALMLWSVAFLLGRMKKHSIAYGIVGWSMLAGLSLSQLLLAMGRDDLLYLQGFSIEMILATIMFVGSSLALLKLSGVKIVKPKGTNQIPKLIKKNL